MKVELKKVECELISGVTREGKPYKRLNILDRTACEKIFVFVPEDVSVSSSDRYNVTLNLSPSGKFYFDSISKA